MLKQYEMLKTILHFHKRSLEAIEAGADTAGLFKLEVREEIARAKYIPQEEVENIPKIRQTIDQNIQQLTTGVKPGA
jgi:V/A-type H+-transporting ATPase subunit A